MKVTKELFDKVKDGYACSGLSIRTVKNITRSKNYTEYRQKYCEKKTKETKQQNILNDYLDSIYCEVTNSQMSFDILSDTVERNYTLLFKLLLINLVVTVIGFAIIIALIAW